MSLHTAHHALRGVKTPFSMSRFFRFFSGLSGTLSVRGVSLTKSENGDILLQMGGAVLSISSFTLILEYILKISMLVQRCY